jgi:hypothetical protein
VKVNPFLAVIVSPSIAIESIRCFRYTLNTTVFFCIYATLMIVLYPPYKNIQLENNTQSLYIIFVGFGVLFYFAKIHVLSVTLSLIGRALGGFSSNKDIRLALIWAQVPLVLCLVVLLLDKYTIKFISFWFETLLLIISTLWANYLIVLFTMKMQNFGIIKAIVQNFLPFIVFPLLFILFSFFR